MFTVAASAATILLFPNLRSRLVMVDLLVVRVVFVFEDLDSRNGFPLVERNGQRHIINATMPVKLEVGDQLLLGDLQNPVVIEILSIELEDTLASATVVGSRSILGQLPTLKTIGDADSYSPIRTLTTLEYARDTR